MAVLRYRVSNPGKDKAQVAIAFSLDNPVGVDPRSRPGATRPLLTARSNEIRRGAGLEGLFMTHPEVAADCSSGRIDCSLCYAFRERQRDVVARVAARQVVGQSAAVLG